MVPHNGIHCYIEKWARAGRRESSTTLRPARAALANSDRATQLLLAPKKRACTTLIYTFKQSRSKENEHATKIWRDHWSTSGGPSHPSATQEYTAAGLVAVMSVSITQSNTLTERELLRVVKAIALPKYQLRMEKAVCLTTSKKRQRFEMQSVHPVVRVDWLHPAGGGIVCIDSKQ